MRIIEESNYILVKLIQFANKSPEPEINNNPEIAKYMNILRKEYTDNK